MKFKRRNALLSSLLIMSLNASANTIYYVKPGDTLSQILQDNNIIPIYGKKGSLKKVLALNPLIKISKGNVIFPKMKILILPPSANPVIPYANVQEVNNEQPFEVKAVADASEIIVPFKEVQEVVQVKEVQEVVQVKPVEQVEQAVQVEEVKKEAPAIVKAEEVVPQKNLVELNPNSERSPSSDFEQEFFWKISPLISWKNIAAKDDNANSKASINALSDMIYGVSAQYGMHFEENLDVYSKLSLQSVRFLEENSITLIKKNFLLTRFAVGMNFSKNWQFELAMADKFFLTAPKKQTVELKKVSLPEIKMIYGKDFYNYHRASFGYSVSGSGYLPKAAPGIKSKLGYGAGAAFTARLVNQTFEVGYDYDSLKATGNSTNEQTIYWKYTWQTK